MVYNLYLIIINLNLFINFGLPLIYAAVETEIYPKRAVRHLPLSKLKEDAFDQSSNKKKTKKLYFSRPVIEEFKILDFKYTEIPEYYQYVIPKDELKTLTYADQKLSDFQYFNQTLIKTNPQFQKLFDSKEYYQLTDHDIKKQKIAANKYLNQLFDGPQFDLDVRKSTLSELIGFEIFGLFAREFIPNNSVLGNYVGIQGFGASVSPGKFKMSDKEYEYTYDAERDYIDNAYKGNFMRFINHQTAPMVGVEKLYVPSKLLLKTGKITKELYDELPSLIEAMVFTTAQDIYPGEEIFSNYGDGYWTNRNVEPVMQRSVESINRHLKELNKQIVVLEEEREQIVHEVKALRRALEKLIERTDNDDIW